MLINHPFAEPQTFPDTDVAGVAKESRGELSLHILLCDYSRNVKKVNREVRY